MLSGLPYLLHTPSSGSIVNTNQHGVAWEQGHLTPTHPSKLRLLPTPTQLGDWGPSHQLSWDAWWLRALTPRWAAWWLRALTPRWDAWWLRALTPSWDAWWLRALIPHWDAWWLRAFAPRWDAWWLRALTPSWDAWWLRALTPRWDAWWLRALTPSWDVNRPHGDCNQLSYNCQHLITQYYIQIFNTQYINFYQNKKD